IAAAIATLDDTEFTERHFNMNEDGRRFLKEEMEKLGFTVYPSWTNFLFVHVERDGKKLFDELLQKGIIVRPCHGWGFDEYVRVSIGTKEQNEWLMETLKTIL